jgi:DNA-binding GntR family transcriptional regulator
MLKIVVLTGCIPLHTIAHMSTKSAAAPPGKKRSTATAARSRSRSLSTPAPRDRGSLRLAREHILARIAAGDFPAGTPLSELPLAAQVGVSRTPVREAIGQLVIEGILQKTSRGVIVAEPTRRDVNELYELREALEVFAISKLATRGLDPQELESMETLVNQVRAVADELKESGKPVLKGEALQRFLMSDLRFHMRLIQAAGNERLLKMLDSTNLLLRIFTLRREHHTLKLLKEVHSFHRRILDAVVNGQEEQARRLLSEHIHLSRDERLAEYDEVHSNGHGW